MFLLEMHHDRRAVDGSQLSISGVSLSTLVLFRGTFFFHSGSTPTARWLWFTAHALWSAPRYCPAVFLLTIFTPPPSYRFLSRGAGCKVVVDSERYGNFIVAPTLVRYDHDRNTVIEASFVACRSADITCSWFEFLYPSL